MKEIVRGLIFKSPSFEDLRSSVREDQRRRCPE
jgi:hypothetical protein